MSAGIVLAAGAGRRMGGIPKPLLQREGETLLARQLRLLRQAGVAPVVAVLGHHAAVLQAELERLQAPDVRHTLNTDPDLGTASSLRCGLLALPADVASVCVLLADQPLLESDDVQAMLAAWKNRDPGVQLMIPCHDAQPGHPVVFGAAVRAAVLAGQSVPQWRRQHPQQVRRLAFAHARHVRDVDTPADLQRLAEQTGVQLQMPALGAHRP